MYDSPYLHQKSSHKVIRFGKIPPKQTLKVVQKIQWVKTFISFQVTLSFFVHSALLLAWPRALTQTCILSIVTVLTNFLFVWTFSIWLSTLWGIEADCCDSGSLSVAPRSLAAHEPAPVLEILITPSLHAGTARYTCSRTETIRSLDNDR